ncbi:MAG: hypothetical protein AVDCRST_MAG33-1655 [uncultured Thermomicrobiales bacterium]|uniref:Uncharacterized protein n=1 Tax=uncultured Thermomicrobiales bacterium TaxID=1645740 RepID=A0A6J4UXI5_9BACT|nr:MAG: hypothetical protein AVDCRST_MAG33-1655 [uncultured Thermomicrobiales bacterium]
MVNRRRSANRSERAISHRTDSALSVTGFRLPPYRYARIAFLRGQTTQRVSDEHLRQAIKNLSTGEGLIHIADAQDRIASTMGLVRVSPTLRERIAETIEDAVKYNDIRRQGDFIWPKKNVPVSVRGPRRDGIMRSLERIAPEELDEAVFLFVQSYPWQSRLTISSQVARAFGIMRATAGVQSVLGIAVQRCIDNRRLREEGDLIVPLARRASRPATRNHD